MLSINELKIGTKIVHNGEPYEILKAQHSKIGRGGAVLKARMRNLITGNVLEINFKGSDKFETADMDSKKALYMYKDGQGYNFMDNESYEQFTIPENVIADKKVFLIENTNVEILYYNSKPINIEIPIKMAFKVVKAPPGTKGNTADGGTKEVELETGLKVNVPLFIKEGDVIKVNTQEGTYVERA
jgi:elongation factor P